MFNNLTIRKRLATAMGSLLVLLVGVGAAGVIGMHYANSSMEQIYKQRMQSVTQFNQIYYLITQNQMRVAETVTSQLTEAPDDRSVVDNRLAVVRANIAKINELWKNFETTARTPGEDERVKAFKEALQTYLRQGLQPTLAALSARDFMQAGEIYQGVMRQAFVPVSEAAEALIQQQQELANKDYESAMSLYAVMRAGVIAAVLIGIALARTLHLA